MKCSGLEKEVYIVVYRLWYNVYYNCVYILKCFLFYIYINIVLGDDVVGFFLRCENIIGVGSSYGFCELNFLLVI